MSKDQPWKGVEDRARQAQIDAAEKEAARVREAAKREAMRVAQQTTIVRQEAQRARHRAAEKKK